MRVDVKALERKYLSAVSILEDSVRIPRIFNGGRPEDSQKRYGKRTIRWREPALSLGWPQKNIWRRREITFSVEVAYGGHDSIATVESLQIHLSSAPRQWPFRWLHELILSKWLSKLQRLEIVDRETHALTRRVLRLNYK